MEVPYVLIASQNINTSIIKYQCSFEVNKTSLICIRSQDFEDPIGLGKQS